MQVVPLCCMTLKVVCENAGVIQDFTYCLRGVRLSFQELKARYGNPLVVLNLVKRNEKRPREMWLGREFEAAIEYANKQVLSASLPHLSASSSGSGCNGIEALFLEVS